MPPTPSPVPTTPAPSASCAGERCAAPPIRATRLVAEATRWATFAAGLVSSRRFCPHEKALAALGFTLRAGLGALAVPTKLVGTKACQQAVRALRRSGASFGVRLRLEEREGRLAVVWSDAVRGGRLLGFVQRKHEPWLRPLVGYGVELRLIGVTGRESAGQTLGVNVAVCLLPGSLRKRPSK